MNQTHTKSLGWKLRWSITFDFKLTKCFSVISLSTRAYKHDAHWSFPGKYRYRRQTHSAFIFQSCLKLGEFIAWVQLCVPAVGWGHASWHEHICAFSLNIRWEKKAFVFCVIKWNLFFFTLFSQNILGTQIRLDKISEHKYTDSLSNSLTNRYLFF